MEWPLPTRRSGPPPTSLATNPLAAEAVALALAAGADLPRAAELQSESTLASEEGLSLREAVRAGARRGEGARRGGGLRGAGRGVAPAERRGGTGIRNAITEAEELQLRSEGLHAETETHRTTAAARKSPSPSQ